MTEAGQGTRAGDFRWTFVAALAIGLPIGAHLAHFVATRVDAPFLDDFDAILGFALRFRAADGLGERLAVLFEPHVDHRLVVTRLVTLALAGLQGRIDFVALSAVGQGLWLGVFAGLAWTRLRRRDGGADAVAALVPVALLLFQPQAYDVVQWPTASIASFGALAFATAALACLARRGAGWLAAATGCAVLATLSQGNGIAVFPAGALALWNAGRTRRAWAFGGVAALAVAAFALTFEGRAAGQALAWLWRLPTTGRAFLDFVGAAPAFGIEPLAQAIALALLATLAWLTWHRAARRDLVAYGLALFLLGTAFGNAVLRGGLGADYALGQPRYRIAGALLLAVVHLGVWDRLHGVRRRAWLVAAVTASLVFCLASSWHFGPRVGEQSALAARSLARWTVTGTGLVHPAPARASRRLHEAAAAGLFRPELAQLARYLDHPVALALPAPRQDALQVGFERAVAGAGLLVVEGRVAAGRLSPAAQVFLVLDGGDAPAVYTAERLPGPRSAPRPADGMRFRALVPYALTPGAEPPTLGLLLVERGERRYVQSTRRPRIRDASASAAGATPRRRRAPSPRAAPAAGSRPFPPP